MQQKAHDYIRHPTFDILHPGGVDPDHGLLKADTTAGRYRARRQVSGQVNRGDAQRAVALERLEDENEAGPLAVVEAGDPLAQGTSIDGLA